MTTQIQKQQVQGLVGAISDISTISGQLVGVNANLTYDLAATGYFLGQLVTGNAADLNATGATLSAAILQNTNLIDATGTYFTFLFDSLSSGSIATVSGDARYANYSLASDFRLNDYVLQTSLTGIPTGTLKEASSVCYNPSGCTYLVLSPDPTSAPSIKEYEFGGTGIVRSTQYSWPAGYADVEGITHVLGNQFALCSEFKTSTSKNAILLFDYIGNSNLGGTIPSSDFTVYDVGNPYYPAVPSNIGLEGISYNPSADVFYGAVEGNDTYAWKVLEIKLGVAPATTTGELFSSGTVNFTPALQRLSDVYYDPNSRHLFLTDHGTGNYPESDRSRVFECDLQGNLIDYVDLKDAKRNNYNQIEGITFSPDGGRMVIAGEAGDSVGSDLGFYTISSFADSGVYKMPASMPQPDAYWASSFTSEGVLTTTYVLREADHGTYIHCDGGGYGSIALVLPDASISGQFDGFQCDVFNQGAFVVTINANTLGRLTSKGTTLIADNTWAKVWCLNGMWYAAGDLT
tara:strand:+ start:4259 stop:5812 length:1554 start_codon:yes stop_codon:yes gene_type:complete